MRRQLLVKIGDRSVPVRELSVAYIERAYEDDSILDTLAGVLTGNPTDIKKLLKESTELSEKEVNELCEGVNSYTILTKALREVNSDFFGTLPQELNRINALARELPSRK